MRYWFLSLFIILQLSLFSQEQTVGLFTNDEGSVNGYTLFTNSRTTHLIDNCGFQVNSWESDFNPGLGVYLLPNGNLLRTGRVSGAFNGGGVGGQFELISWDGDVLWSYTFADETRHSHHDIEPLPNGNFLTLAWTPMTGDEAVAAGRSYNNDLWIEKIYEIKIVGEDDIEIVWEWSTADHLVQDKFDDRPNFGVVSENPGKIDFNYLPPDDGLDRDWMHFNAIDYNEELDQIAVSSRDMSEIYIIDHSTTTSEAATSFGGNSDRGGDILYRYGNPQVYGRGSAKDQVLFNQHNIEWINDDYENGGSLSVFNNRWGADRSRVERWTAPMIGNDYYLEPNQPYGPQLPDWTYDSEGFYSSRISGVQFLENGNALICSGGNGHFFEVTEAGDIVWDYINPMRTSQGPATQGLPINQNSVFRALRYSPDYPAFDGRDLIAGDPIELEPFDSKCVITSIGEVDISISDVFQISYTLTSNILEVISKKRIIVYVFNQNGVQVKEAMLIEGQNQLDVSDYPKGMYFLVSEGSVSKFIKY